mmetsp:Transcript_27755/g.83651  ORF Transcript_27755/g.83651 Transcript_27755/m.83651 type:complete len:383 (-) Transcript_27755:147-1295(-)
MVLEIGRFQAEREALESERDDARAQLQSEQDQRLELEGRVSDLVAEVERLRAERASRAASSSPQPSLRQEESGELRRVHHEKQLAFMATIDSLRSELDQERARADAFERDRNSGQAGPEQDSSMQTARASYERKCREVRALEDETLQLREELNREKHKVVEMKKAANSRASQWKEQLEQITGELAQKQRLEEENQQLRVEQALLRKEYATMKREVERLRSEVSEARARRGGHFEELDILSNTMAGQLHKVEQELSDQAQRNAQLLELFLRHIQQPLSSVQRCCRQMTLQSGDAFELTGLRLLRDREVPPLSDVGVHDLKGNLVRIVNLVRYAAEVLEAFDGMQPQSQCSVDVPLASGRGATLPEDPESLSTTTSSWFRGVFT